MNGPKSNAERQLGTRKARPIIRERVKIKENYGTLQKTIGLSTEDHIIWTPLRDHRKATAEAEGAEKTTKR